MNKPYHQRNGLRAAAGLALVLIPAALTAPAARAQSSGPVVNDKPTHPIALKIGAYFPVREGFRNVSDDVIWNLGMSIDAVRTPGGYTTVGGLYVDSAFNTSSDHKGTVTGVGVQSRTYLRNGSSGTGGDYALVGLGGYYQYAKLGGVSNSEWRFGGKLGLGLDTGNRAFVEITYTAIDGGKVDGDGVGVSLGVRF